MPATCDRIFYTDEGTNPERKRIDVDLFFFSSSPPGKTIWAAALLFYQGETWITLLSGFPTCYGGT
jgi:hypothetical protein